MGERVRDAGTDLVDMAKVTLLLRLVAFVPVVVGWSATDPPPVAHVVLLVLLAVLNAGMLLGWSRVGPLIRRHPSLVGVDVLVSLVVLLGPSPPSPFLLYTLSSALLVGLLFPGRAVAVLAALLASTHLLESRLRDPAGAPVGQELITTASLYGLMAATGWVFQRLHREHVESLEAYHAVERAQREVAAVDAERARLAREMHDSVAKSLLGLRLDAAALARSAPAGGDVAQRAGRVASAARQAAEESRRLLRDLRGLSADAPPVAVGVPVAVSHWSDQTGVEAVTTVEPAVAAAAVDDPTRWALLRCLDEALENVRRHAGAHRVSVAVVLESEQTRRCVVLRVQDDGQGFDPDRVQASAGDGHFGLTGVRERVEGVGGRLVLRSAPAAGTTLEVRVPAGEAAVSRAAEVYSTPRGPAREQTRGAVA